MPAAGDNRRVLKLLSMLNNIRMGRQERSVMGNSRSPTSLAVFSTSMFQGQLTDLIAISTTYGLILAQQAGYLALTRMPQVTLCGGQLLPD